MRKIKRKRNASKEGKMREKAPLPPLVSNSSIRGLQEGEGKFSL
jgi:hypothetical protein